MLRDCLPDGIAFDGLTRYYDDLCNLDFSATGNLKKHFNTPRHIAQSWAHGVPVNRIPPKLYTGKYGCKACPYRSNQKWGVYQHAKRIHIKARFDETGPIDAKSYLIEYPDEPTWSIWHQLSTVREWHSVFKVERSQRAKPKNN